MKTELLPLKNAVAPNFDIEKTAGLTRKNPVWLHFGAGNLFRAFPAVLIQDLLEQGLTDKGVVVCEAFDEEIIDGVYKPFGNMHAVITLGADGSRSVRVIASITEAFGASGNYERLKEICANPGLQIISLTVTEKGYSGGIPELIAKLCRERLNAGGFPLTLLSLDNCAENGAVLKRAVLKHADGDLADYLSDGEKISFPLSMIDKITPRPSEKIAESLKSDGLSAKIVKTAKNTFVSSFVNTEKAQYLAVEDWFPNGRPPLEKVGVIVCSRETVTNIEAMKVRAALNPLHTALSIFARLLNYGYVFEAMRDNYIKRLVERLAYGELIPTVTDPVVISPAKFADEVINERFPNPYIPDTPSRILCDTSQKIPVRFGETLKAYAEKNALRELTYIPLVIAGWLRYLQGKDDEGTPFELSPDPRLGELSGYIKERDYDGLLSKADIFGVDLVFGGLSGKIKDMLSEMSEIGGVRRVLEIP